MGFVDGLGDTLDTFFRREVDLSAGVHMYELAIHEWGKKEVTQLNAESLVHLVDMVQNPDYQRVGVVIKIQQRNGVQTFTIPAWAVCRLCSDLAHGNIRLPYIE